MIAVRNVTRGTVLATDVIVAETSRTRRTGLLKHHSLPAGQGMWIVPSEGIHTFGMKFSIDALFLDRKDKVVKIRPEMPPRRLALCLRAYSVLELPAGTAARTGTAAGDQLEFEEDGEPRPTGETT
jgi:uncharacterized membrane protein (UPF0127 family)